MGIFAPLVSLREAPGSGRAGAPIYMELRRFTFKQQQICYFFPVDHQHISIGGVS